MFVRPPELEIPPDNPFEHDKLERDKLEPTLSAFVASTEGPLVLAIEGAFGSGKTTLLKMWEHKLKAEGHVCFYVNAWKSDFAEDPLVALVGELSEEISNLPRRGRYSRYLNKLKKAAGSIAKRSVPVGVRLLTAGLVDSEEILAKELPDLASKLAEDRIRAYEAGKSEIESFREALHRLTAEVLAEGKFKAEEESEASDQASEENKVVILIDELDRCRPTYAIELLERVKHLFDVPGVIFVLGVDREQLSHSVKAMYGAGFDATGYLRRFIDIDYHLPEPDSATFCRHLFEVFGVRELLGKRRHGGDDPGVFEGILSELVSVVPFTLREQVQLVGRLRVVLQTMQTRHCKHLHHLAVLLFLREWDFEAYQGLQEGRVDIDELIRRFENLYASASVGRYDHLTNIQATLLDGATELRIESQRYQQLLKQEENAEGREASEVLNIANSLSSSGPGMLKTFERINLTEPFDLELG